MSATKARPKTRLYVDEELGEGTALRLASQQAHYLRNVLRLERGDAIALFNGRDGEWLARIDGFGKGWCSVVVGEHRRDQEPDGDLWLMFAPIKRTRLDLVAEKATELGVGCLWPIFTRHTDVGRVNTERLRANAVEAAEQCERLSVPEIREPVRLEEAIARWPADRRLILAAEAGPVKPIAAALAAIPRGPVAVMIGPEGGFAKSELDGLLDLPFVVPVGLGPRILRADTAALAVLACWQALAGDWAVGGAAVRPPHRMPE